MRGLSIWEAGLETQGPVNRITNLLHNLAEVLVVVECVADREQQQVDSLAAGEKSSGSTGA